jgi:hypothetical protein
VHGTHVAVEGRALRCVATWQVGLGWAGRPLEVRDVEGIDPTTLHGLQTREQKHLCEGGQAPSDLTYELAWRQASQSSGVGERLRPLYIQNNLLYQQHTVHTEVDYDKSKFVSA